MKFLAALILLTSFSAFSQSNACSFSQTETTTETREFEASSTWFYGVGSDSSCDKARRKCQRAQFMDCRVVGGGGGVVLEGAVESGSCIVRGTRPVTRRLGTREFCSKINSCLLEMMNSESLDPGKLQIAETLYERNRCQRHL